jgi:hypothetical protein
VGEDGEYAFDPGVPDSPPVYFGDVGEYDGDEGLQSYCIVIFEKLYTCNSGCTWGSMVCMLVRRVNTMATWDLI